MADETPKAPAPPAEPSTPTQPLSFNIGEEFGTAKKNLPPAKIVLIVLGALVVVSAIAAFVLRSKPAGTGAIGEISAVEIPNQNAVMAAVNLSFHNKEKTTFWIRNIKVEIDTGNGKFSDEAASAVDYDRYYQAFPALKARALAALKRQDQIPSGGDGTGTVLVTFPVTMDAFNNRKSTTVTITADDQPVPIVLTK